MKEIVKQRIINNYIDDEVIIDKFLYFKDVDKDYTKYYLLKVHDIELLNNNEIIYHTTRCHQFVVPNNYNGKCFVYDDIKDLKINYKKITLYEMNIDEYTDTYRVFVENYGKFKSYLPDKIIQDKC